MGLDEHGELGVHRATMSDTPTPISSAAAAEGCAIGLLRNLADALETLPRAQKADALRLLIPTLTEVDRVATLLGLRK
jgi:hypothetical protein